MRETSPIPILAVDDEEMIREYIFDSLEGGDYLVIRAASAREAFEALEAQAASLGALVTDVNLGPGQPTGWEVARRARELNATLPVVYITGDSAAAWAAQRVSHSILVQKPFKCDDLVAAMTALRATS